MKRFTTYALFVSWLIAAAFMLFRIYSLHRHPPENPFMFWVPYAVFISASCMMVLYKKKHMPLFVILGMTVVLNLIPRIREPATFLWNVDSTYHLEIASQIVDTGQLTIGNVALKGQAFAFSCYPGLDLLLTNLHIVTGLPLLLVYRFTFTFMNLTTILFLYYLLRKLINHDLVVNTAVFLYVLCPKLHSFNSASVAESLAIIFYPILIFTFIMYRSELFRKRKFLTILVLFVFVVTVTHHWTMYMLMVHAAIILLGMFLIKRRVSTPRASLLLLLTVLTCAWLVFNAVIILTYHSEFATAAIQNLLGYVSGGGEPTVAPYSMPPLEKLLSYSGVGILVLTSLIGVYELHKGRFRNLIPKNQKIPFSLFWLTDLVLLGLIEVINWQTPSLMEVVNIRFRTIEFNYFGLVSFSAIGIVALLLKISHPQKIFSRFFSLGATVCLLVLIAVPTVTIGFSYYHYDNPPMKASNDDNAFPFEAYYFSIWLKHQNVSTTVASTMRETNYIQGYAHKKASYSLLRESFEQHRTLAELYCINKANLVLFDDMNFKLQQDDMNWLDGELNKIYDNDGILVYLSRIQK